MGDVWVALSAAFFEWMWLCTIFGIVGDANSLLVQRIVVVSARHKGRWRTRNKEYDRFLNGSGVCM